MFIKLIKIFNLLVILIFSINIYINNKLVLNENINLIYNKYKLYKLLLSNDNRNISIVFNLTYINYCFSFKYNYVMIEYNLGFYDEDNYIIFPSDLSLYNNFSIFCYIELKNQNKSIYSFAGVVNNSFYNCKEFINLNEKINFGIIIYKNYEYANYYIIPILNEKIINYEKKPYLKDNIFNPILLTKEYETFLQKMSYKNLNESLKLKNSYIKYPYCILKRKVLIKEIEWKFANIFNHYFCFCKGYNCLNINLPQKCKFYFYKNIININQNLYIKTDFLFIDLIFAELSSDDVYPVFKEMEMKKYPVHYLTEKIEIYNEYSYKEKNKLTIILLKKEKYYHCGDFLEKYLSLFLKLKVVVSGKYTNLHSISILFYDIKYITYIAVGHGVCYFKDYLYDDNRLYGRKRNNKILIPPSEKLISIAKKHGWKEADIIKINLPRWDKYLFKNKNKFLKNKISSKKENFILVMFTWREINKNEKISSFYVNNIINLLTNNKLIFTLNSKKVKVYFSLHRYMIDKYKNIFNNNLKKNKFIQYINQNNISRCISESNLIVSDFSSIIFDFIYRQKPFILYIPDINEPQIKKIYTKDYFDIIDSFKNKYFRFENTFFEINETIKKIIYYINNDFNLEKNLKNFYDSFNFTQKKVINELINYLKKLK